MIELNEDPIDENFNIIEFFDSLLDTDKLNFFNDLIDHDIDIAIENIQLDWIDRYQSDTIISYKKDNDNLIIGFNGDVVQLNSQKKQLITEHIKRMYYDGFIMLKLPYNRDPKRHLSYYSSHYILNMENPIPICVN